MRLIDADALMEVLDIAEECKECKHTDGIFCGRSYHFSFACEAITNAPTIDITETEACQKCQESVDKILVKALPDEKKMCLEDDGTLWVTVDDCDKVKRVIVDEHDSKWCRVFYEEPMRWIPVEEGLPEIEYDYLVTIRNSFVTIASFQKLEGWSVWDDEAQAWDITAWMELPEPYKRGTE